MKKMIHGDSGIGGGRTVTLVKGWSVLGNSVAAAKNPLAFLIKLRRGSEDIAAVMLAGRKYVVLQSPGVCRHVLVSLAFMYTVVTAVLVSILLMPMEKMESQRQENEQWAVEILAHNVDFSPRSQSLNQLAGGANLNVVHYLFHDACHVHYTRLAEIIANTAAEYGLVYRKQELRDVFDIPFNYLKNILKNNQA